MTLILRIAAAAALAVTVVYGAAHAQSQRAAEVGSADGTTEIHLRKSVGVREYQGRQVSGEDRQIGRGDSLWRILVEEKGVPERRFPSYLTVIRGLNPHLKSLDVLRVGDKVFLPIRFEDIDKAPPRAEPGTLKAAGPTSGRTVNYQVRAGDHVYRILRDRFKFSDERTIAHYYALVKDLNPERKNWDSLLEGEIIRLPGEESSESAKTENRGTETGTGVEKSQQVTPAPQATGIVAKPTEGAPRITAAARDNIDILLQVASAIGNVAERSGEEVVQLPGGAVRLDRNEFPIVYNPVLRQRVVMDRDGRIPAALKNKLNDPSIGIPVVAITRDVNVAEAVRQLLAGVGYRSLPSDRPVVVHDGGVSLEARGDWVFLAPTVSSRAQEVVVVNLAERANEIPEYLVTAFAKQGLYLREIVVGNTEPRIVQTSAPLELRSFDAPRELPKDRREFVDALLRSFQIQFRAAETIPVNLGTGLRVDTLVDRVFELEGKHTALLFHRVDPIIRKALLERHGMSVVEIEVSTLSSREIIGQFLQLLGARAVYNEHRFAAAGGSANHRVMLKAWGFSIPERSMFLTDRRIPPPFHRFFFEKGLDIVYFQ